MTLHQKAWEINPNRLLEPWFSGDEVYYGTRGQAKSSALPDYDAARTCSDEEITYLNIPIRRAKNMDKYLVNGEIKTRSQIEYDEEKACKFAEIDDTVSNNPNSKAYIRKGGYYYRPDCNGYCSSVLDAGVYSVQEAAKSVKRSSLGDCMALILIDKEDHNRAINNRIADLKTRLI